MASTAIAFTVGPDEGTADVDSDQLAAPSSPMRCEAPEGTGFSQPPFNEGSLTSAAARPPQTPVLLPAPRAEPASRFIPHERREGVVIDVDETEFVARLVDTMGDEPDVTATFSRDDLSPGDLRLLKPGAVFYWSVGYSESRTGQRSRVADIVFRRLPGRASLERARHQAADIRRELGLE